MRRVVAFAIAAVLLGGCQLLPIGHALRALPPPERAQIEITNQTALDLNLFVNGAKVVAVPSSSGITLGSDRLPGLPWSVKARTAKGRVIGSFTAHQSDLQPTQADHGGVGWTIAGDRVDLSCGQLVMWAGEHPIAGPPPGPGSPGDCES